MNKSIDPCEYIFIIFPVDIRKEYKLILRTIFEYYNLFSICIDDFNLELGIGKRRRRHRPEFRKKIMTVVPFLYSRKYISNMILYYIKP